MLVDLLCVEAKAQAPNGISYQAVLRDADGVAMANQAATLRLNLTSDDGTTVYFSEIHSVQTNALGMIKVVLGGGQVETGNFAGVPWSSGGPIYLKVEVKLDGQPSYTPMGSERLQSVPYALHAANGPLVEGTTGQTLRHDGSTWVASSLITNNGTNIGVNTGTPTRLLDVNGDQRLRGQLYDNTNTAGTNGQFLGKGAGSVLWQNLPEGLRGSGDAGALAIWRESDSLASLPNMTFNSSLSVMGNPTNNPDDPIFEVKNSKGDIIF